jgi:tetratricopeptide (TPR) repeat protein
MSQLLARLEAQQSATNDPLLLAEIKARRSCYLSRIGRFEESRFLIAELRKYFGAGQSGRISVWIMLAEGIADIFQNLGSLARDRISRAQLIALALRDRELGAITSAWKAQVEFEVSDFDVMFRSLQTAHDLSQSENTDAEIRISMVVSNGFFLCGDRANGQVWFMRSRDYALAAGDQATIDALLYNRAALGVADLRVQRCFSEVDPSLLSLVHMEVSSARNFQIITNDLSLNNLTELSKARILLMKGDFQESYAALGKIRSAGPFPKYNFSDAMIDLEVALCAVGLGRYDEAMTLCKRAQEFDFSGFDVDDQLVASWIKLELAKRDERCGSPEIQLIAFQDLSERYLSHRRKLHSRFLDLAKSWGR